MTGGKDRMRSTTEEASVVGLIFLSLEVETMPKKKDKDRLRLWQDRLRRAQSAYQREVDKMEDREDMYLGAKNIRPIVSTARKTETPHVRNLAAEMIESQVDSNIPQPKVTPRRKQDEWRAKLIEDMLRNELDRLPFEQINDIQERTVPIQGGAAYLVEWDNAKRTQSTIGEINVSALHPRQIVPQDGVYTGIEDMDYIFLTVPFWRPGSTTPTGSTRNTPTPCRCSTPTTENFCGGSPCIMNRRTPTGRDCYEF